MSAKPPLPRQVAGSQVLGHGHLWGPLFSPHRREADPGPEARNRPVARLWPSLREPVVGCLRFLPPPHRPGHTAPPLAPQTGLPEGRRCAPGRSEPRSQISETSGATASRQSVRSEVSPHLTHQARGRAGVQNESASVTGSGGQLQGGLPKCHVLAPSCPFPGPQSLALGAHPSGCALAGFGNSLFHQPGSP